MKWLKCAGLEHLEDSIAVWIRQVNAKNEMAVDEVEEHVKVLGSADECDRFCSQYRHPPL